MSSFLRIAGAAAVVFSLGYMATALPVTFANISAPTGTDAVSQLCAKLIIEGELQAKLKALLLCVDLHDLNVKITALAALLKGCADDLLKIGAGVAVEVDAKVSLVACIASIITLCVQVFVALSVKFGIAICVELDIALRAFLGACGVCVDGILVLVAKACTSAIVNVMLQLDFKLCLAVLGL